MAIQLSVATPELHPRSTRGFGCRVEADARTLRLSVAEAQSEQFLAALRTTARVAVNFGHVVDFRSIQAKGTRIEVRQAVPAEQEAARVYARELAEVMKRVGVPEGAERGFFHSGPLVVVRVRADVLFDQTPGSGAGVKLGATWQRL